MTWLLLAVRTAASEGASDDSLATLDFSEYFLATGGFRPTRDCPATARFQATPSIGASQTLEHLSWPPVADETGVSVAWLIIALVLIGALAVAGAVTFIVARKRRRGGRAAGSQQMDEQASDPLLLPDNFF
jgi:hypothetical protein